MATITAEFDRRDPPSLASEDLRPCSQMGIEDSPGTNRVGKGGIGSMCSGRGSFPVRHVLLAGVDVFRGQAQSGTNSRNRARSASPAVGFCKIQRPQFLAEGDQVSSSEKVGGVSATS